MYIHVNKCIIHMHLSARLKIMNLWVTHSDTVSRLYYIMSPKKQAPDSSGLPSGFGKRPPGQVARPGPYTTPPEAKPGLDGASVAVGTPVPEGGEQLGDHAPSPSPSALIDSSVERLKMSRAQTSMMKSRSNSKDPDVAAVHRHVLHDYGSLSTMGKQEFIEK